ncbi:MAG: bifunctional glutamate N-acetyltransferase/amino-acid acetyltransferase ArgJ [Gemmataceae bacterium]
METWRLPRGFRYAGIHCGIRPDSDRLDLALVVSDVPASAAGVFTQNRVCAAPVQISNKRLPRGDARAIVICSGNANACTGKQGLADALRMTEKTAFALSCKPEQVLVCSTGVIGRPLPMDKIEPGIDRAGQALAADAAALDKAAHAILTTDTRIKVSTRQIKIGANEYHLAGFAKGAAMIGPNMATLLAFVLTDASIAPADLDSAATRAAARSFNCISVEGHTSTNDSLIFMANGSGPHLIEDGLARFEEAAVSVCTDLAREIAGDAEGGSHLITLEVEGLRTELEAKLVAKTVADSPLVKTAFFGADPNWGRIVSAVGYSGVIFEEGDLSLYIGPHLLYDRGAPKACDLNIVSDYMKKNRELKVRIVFGLGTARCTFYTCDLTYDYVRINAEYTT